MSDRKAHLITSIFRAVEETNRVAMIISICSSPPLQDTYHKGRVLPGLLFSGAIKQQRNTQDRASKQAADRCQGSGQEATATANAYWES